MKIVWNTCNKELGGEMKSVNQWKLLENFQKLLPFSDVYVKCLEKNSI